MFFRCKIADFRGFEKKPLLKWAGARYAFCLNKTAAMQYVLTCYVDLILNQTNIVKRKKL